MLQKNRWSLYFDKSLAQLNFAQFALQLMISVGIFYRLSWF
ncbi:hypothetical protein [Kingella negevensis]